MAVLEEFDFKYGKTLLLDKTFAHYLYLRVVSSYVRGHILRDVEQALSNCGLQTFAPYAKELFLNAVTPISMPEEADDSRAAFMGKLLYSMRNERLCDRIGDVTASRSSTFLRCDDSLAEMGLKAIAVSYADVIGAHGRNRDVQGARLLINHLQGLLAENPEVITTPSLQCLFVIAVMQKWRGERIAQVVKPAGRREKWLLVDDVSASNYKNRYKERYLLDAFQPDRSNFERGMAKTKAPLLYLALKFVIENYEPTDPKADRIYHSPQDVQYLLAAPGKEPKVGITAEQASVLYAYENWKRLSPGTSYHLDMLITDDKPDTVEIDGKFLPKGKAAPGTKPISCGVFIRPRLIRKWAKDLEGRPFEVEFREVVRNECEWFSDCGPERITAALEDL